LKPHLKTVRPDCLITSDTAEGAKEDGTLAGKAYLALRRDIISGAIEAGQSLRLEYLKQRYGISFSPIREALNRLHSERLVISTASRGFRVAPFSLQEMWDAIETRILIDCEALRLSLQNADDRWEAQLVGRFHTLTLAASRNLAEASNQQEAEDELEHRHIDFHQGLIAACGSPWLLNLSMQLCDQTERYRRPIMRNRRHRGGAPRDVQQEHEDLLKTALERDASRAAVLLADHYRETGRIIEMMHQSLASQTEQA
jgi:GntR family transcriptional regulator, carbon starvation induced regulator